MTNINQQYLPTFLPKKKKVKGKLIFCSCLSFSNKYLFCPLINIFRWSFKAFFYFLCEEKRNPLIRFLHTYSSLMLLKLEGFIIYTKQVGN